MQAEFTKARLRRKCKGVEELRVHVQEEKRRNGSSLVAWHPRWLRINTLSKNLDQQLSSTFKDFEGVSSLRELQNDGLVNGVTKKAFLLDEHVANLIAVPPGTLDVTKMTAYKKGEVILQDKASCFPAELLIGDKTGLGWQGGDIIDACAAPGNKTTHLAALIASQSRKSRIFACERNAARSKTLHSMVSMAQAGEVVTVQGNTDFLSLDPNDKKFENVTAMLLDPSCSGSGIMNREDVPVLALPSISDRVPLSTTGILKKRKRKVQEASRATPTMSDEMDASTEYSSQPAESTDDQMLNTRLSKLSNLQTHILTHAFAFPSATRITYSTCSLHVAENEAVVARALSTDVARKRGWRVLRREEQAAGLRKWGRRGLAVEVMDKEGLSWSNVEKEACIRCVADDGEGTMGFFVCGFVRDHFEDYVEQNGQASNGGHVESALPGEEEEWNGFSDDIE